MSQLRFMAVASFAGASPSYALEGSGTQRAQHGHDAAGAGSACRAALLSAPCTHAAENPGLVHGFWHRFLFNRFLTFSVCVCLFECLECIGQLAMYTVL